MRSRGDFFPAALAAVILVLASFPPLRPAELKAPEGLSARVQAAIRPGPLALEVAKRSASAFDDGVPLVIAAEPVREPSRAQERDAVLGWLAARLRGTIASMRVLFACGAGRPSRRAMATAFRLLGVPPPARLETEAVDALPR